MALTPRQVLRYLDHSLLSPTVELEELERGCLLGLELEVASLCILPYFVPRAAELLADSSVRVSTVIGFPHGGQSLPAKLAEAEIALRQGAHELDVVLNQSLLASQQFSRVAEEISDLTDLTHEAGGRIKIIFENCYLTGEAKLRLCELCTDAQVDWVKTSTGFGSGGATPDDVKLMRAACPESIQVKASGGIRTLVDAQRYIELGASRIGTSNTERIAREVEQLEPSKF